ncbi:MAG: formylmethanofuran dehydrogenase subunit B, partial [Methanosarcinales archaeon]|nr:formylmethanofuran dehydrogenase subunit B [Methanosarcinales archaeon]
NMYGFNRELYSKTGAQGEKEGHAGFINRVSFKDGIKHDNAYSFINSIKTADCALIIGSDPVSTLPHGCIPDDLDIITIDPHETPTTRRSSVWVQSAISGVECGGSAYRMDGVEVSFGKIIERGFMSDEEILAGILEGVRSN